jgi:D-glycero-alpha-D-manno-heptose 1-phosphate guanylyltransferase
MEAIILAGGFGTRLSTVVSDVPKPMAPINGKPFLELLLEDLEKKGITKVILATGYKKEIIKNYFKDRYKSIEIVYSEEISPLGTGGAIKKAIALAKGNDIFIVNGDTFFDVDLEEMYKFHRKNNSKLTLAVKEMEKFDRYGSLILEENKIIKFEEKKYIEKGYINGGIYLLNREILRNIFEENFSFEKEILENEEREIEKYGYISNSYFIDIGIPEDYYKFEEYGRNEKLD